jgi:hypothetical protein
VSCNMYMYIEKLHGGKWEYIDGDVYEGRCYVLFARLAGVRNNEELEPLLDPRGMPESASLRVFSAKDDYHDGADRRVTSWLTLAELERQDWDEFSGKWNETEFSIGIMNRLRQLADGDRTSVRIVFWFDDVVQTAISGA